MGKVERLISIVMILLQKEVVSATALARLLNVSKRTILRDMETLSLANIPIYALNGVNGGYGIMEQYKWDKRLLSNGDLENIITALGGLEHLLDHEEVNVTIRKVASMARGALPKSAIHLSFYEWQGRTEMAHLLQICQGAIAQKKVVSFTYMDKDGLKSTRMVEPYQLHFSEMSWYLKAFCTDRGGWRTFKLSRTEQLQMERTSFIPREDAAAGQAVEADRYVPPQLETVKALISPIIKERLIERYGSRCVEPYSAEQLLITIQVPQNQFGYQYLAGFGTHLRVIEPAAYVEGYRDFLRAMMENYG